MTTEQTVTILAIDCDTTRIVYHYLCKHGIPVGDVILEQPVSKKQLIRGRIKKLGVLPVLGQLLFIVCINPFLKKRGRARRMEIKKQYGLNESPIPEDKLVRVESVNSDECRALLAAKNTGLILVNGTRIISRKTLQSTSIPFVNIHAGITPLFRGVHGGYWAVATGEKELFGTTIHIVDAGIDTGGALAQVRTIPEDSDNFATYPILQYAICLSALVRILSAYLANGELTPMGPRTRESKLWYHPTLWEYLKQPK